MYVKRKRHETAYAESNTLPTLNNDKELLENKSNIALRYLCVTPETVNYFEICGRIASVENHRPEATIIYMAHPLPALLYALCLNTLYSYRAFIFFFCTPRARCFP